MCEDMCGMLRYEAVCVFVCVRCYGIKPFGLPPAKLVAESKHYKPWMLTNPVEMHRADRGDDSQGSALRNGIALSEEAFENSHFKI